MPKSNINDFIHKARLIHGDKYSYDRFVYIGALIKGIITCPNHGCFKQDPHTHLRSNGCPKCAGRLVSNLEEFIKEANQVHNNKYDYDKFAYTYSAAKGIIICPDHGAFRQSPNHHIRGHGCSKCAAVKNSEKFRSNANEFIQKAKRIHGEKYNYDKFIYINTETKGIIICNDHGEFKQNPNCHLSGNGCPKCASHISYIGSRWLDSLGIPNDPRHREVRKLIHRRQFVADGYIPETNTIYEFYGDAVHGNPNLYNANTRSRFGGRTYGEAYQKTIEREEIFKAAGFNLVTIWESDYRKQLIKEFVENQSRETARQLL